MDTSPRISHREEDVIDKVYKSECKLEMRRKQDIDDINLEL